MGYEILDFFALKVKGGHYFLVYKEIDMKNGVIITTIAIKASGTLATPKHAQLHQLVDNYFVVHLASI